MPYRRYSRDQKARAVAEAEATSVLGTAEATGIPTSTLRYWMDDPAFAQFRQNAREAMAEEASTVARMAWRALAEAMRSGTLEGRDLVLLAGMATDKSQLLNGGATARTEERDISGTLTDSDLILAVREAESLAGAGRAAPPAEGSPEG